MRMTVPVDASATTVNPPKSPAATLSKCLVPDMSSSPIAAASRTSPLSFTPSMPAMASAPPTDEAAELPMPLPGFSPCFTLMVKPVLSQPQSSHSFSAAKDAVFSVGDVETPAHLPVTLTWTLSVLAAVIVTMSLGESRQSPKESNPGPKLAIVAGDETEIRWWYI